MRMSYYSECVGPAVSRRLRRRGAHRLAWALTVVLTGATSGLSAAPDDVIQLLHAGGHVLVIRHAEAPGVGDPQDFRLGDCTTQRNLSEAGRAQARAIGDWLRARGVERARVYSSQWCRCLETAKLLHLGAVTALPALNSFFERPQDREPNLAALRDFFDRQPVDGELMVLVTHQVTITALSGVFPASGTGVLMVLEPDSGARPVARIDFGG